MPEPQQRSSAVEAYRRTVTAASVRDAGPTLITWSAANRSRGRCGVARDNEPVDGIEPDEAAHPSLRSLHETGCGELIERHRRQYRRDGLGVDHVGAQEQPDEQPERPAAGSAKWQDREATAKVEVVHADEVTNVLLVVRRACQHLGESFADLRQPGVGLDRMIGRLFTEWITLN